MAARRADSPTESEGEPGYELVFDDDDTKTVHTSCGRDGIGKAKFVNGDTYHGAYVAGKRHGRGLYTFVAGGKYEGNYVEGRREGDGTLNAPDNGIYAGQWRADKRDGRGKYTYGNGDSYEGDWLKNNKHGQGIYLFSKTKAKITGKWSNGQLLHGTWEMPDGSKYTGPFSGGLPEGEGLFHLPGGIPIAGRFAEQKWLHDVFVPPHHSSAPHAIIEADPFKKACRAVDKAVWKVDHFEAIYKLPKEIEGVPNYRKIEGFPIFGSGQPTYEGLQLMLEKINEMGLDRVVWMNMRVEPVIYVNEMSYAPRDVKNLNENMEFENLSAANLLALEERLTQRVRTDTRRRGGLHHYFRDTFAENPEDRKNTELTSDVKDYELVRSVGMAYEALKEEDFNVEFNRVPIIDERSPSLADFDTLFSLLRELDEKTAVCFNCQMGKGRTTTGTVIATLIRRTLDGDRNEEEEKEDEHRDDDGEHEGEDLDEEDLEPEEREARAKERRERKEKEKKDAEAAKSELPPDYKMGQYSVIMKLVRALGDKKGDKIKNEVDDAIDRCKQLQSLRECIWDAKLKFDSETTASRKGFWKRMATNFLERYFYLICFHSFVKETLALPEPEDPDAPLPTFTKWATVDHRDIVAILGTREGGALAEFDWT